MITEHYLRSEDPSRSASQSLEIGEQVGPEAETAQFCAVYKAGPYCREPCHPAYTSPNAVDSPRLLATVRFPLGAGDDVADYSHHLTDEMMLAAVETLNRRSCPTPKWRCLQRIWTGAAGAEATRRKSSPAQVPCRDDRDNRPSGPAVRDPIAAFRPSEVGRRLVNRSGVHELFD